MRDKPMSHAVHRRRCSTGLPGRLGLLLLALAVLATACGSDDDTTAEEPQPSSEVQPTPTDTATKDAVDPLVSAEASAEPSDLATAEVTEAAQTPAPAAPAAPAQPLGDVVDLPTLSAAIVAAIGRTDVTTALGEIGPFPADIPFPDDAVLLEVSLSETDSRILLGDPEVIRPLNTMTGGVAVTLLKIEEAQQFYLDPLAALGFELSSSGFSATTEGDGTEVRDGFFNRGDSSDSSAPLRENLSLTLIARADSDFVEIDLSYNTDQEAPLSSPVTRWVTGLPVPEGYQMHTARVSTFYFGTPSLNFNAGFNGPGGQIEEAVTQTMALLPAGGFAVGSDTAIGGDPDLRYFDLAYPGVGEGEVAVSDNTGATAIRPSIDVDFPLPPTLEPYLLG